MENGGLFNGGGGGGGGMGGLDNDSLSNDEDEDDENGDDYWHTSVGKFKFTLDQLPQTLQYIHQLLTVMRRHLSILSMISYYLYINGFDPYCKQEIPAIEKPEILYYILQCLKVMALHGDALAKAAREHRGFFIWCQENLLIKK